MRNLLQAVGPRWMQASRHLRGGRPVETIFKFGQEVQVRDEVLSTSSAVDLKEEDSRSSFKGTYLIYLN